MYTRRLRRLYQKQLDDTRAFLSTFLPKTSNAERLVPAVSGRNLEELLDSFEDILCVYAIYGVARDLERLKKTKVLFVKDTNLVPSQTLGPDLDKVLPLGGAAPAFTAAKDSVDPNFTPENAYHRYFSLYIDRSTVWQNGSSKSGVDAFYERYPLLGHAVETVTGHYQKNIQLACTRIGDNWNDIQGMFFSGRTMERLAKIETTGNDFHKGGKQVLILTFGFKDGPDGRVVYKPSAVEIDCQIVGESAALALHKYAYKQGLSLSEIINEYNRAGIRPGGYTSRPLPTYKILPYNCGSIPDAYGYIEFLTHEPSLKLRAVETTLFSSTVAAAAGAFEEREVEASDWITNKLSDALTFYHAFGGLMAMAVAVSLCDLHVQNKRMIRVKSLSLISSLCDSKRGHDAAVEDLNSGRVLPRYLSRQ